MKSWTVNFLQTAATAEKKTGHVEVIEADECKEQRDGTLVFFVEGEPVRAFEHGAWENLKLNP
jgi:hypothetical protein